MQAITSKLKNQEALKHTLARRFLGDLGERIDRQCFKSFELPQPGGAELLIVPLKGD
jgi:hypothetical protein